MPVCLCACVPVCLCACVPVCLCACVPVCLSTDGAWDVCVCVRTYLRTVRGVPMGLRMLACAVCKAFTVG